MHSSSFSAPPFFSIVKLIYKYKCLCFKGTMLSYYIHHQNANILPALYIALLLSLTSHQLNAAIRALFSFIQSSFFEYLTRHKHRSDEAHWLESFDLGYLIAGKIAFLDYLSYARLFPRLYIIYFNSHNNLLKYYYYYVLYYLLNWRLS